MIPSVIDILSHPLAAVLTLAAAAGGGMLGAYVAIWQGILSRRALRTQALVTLQELGMTVRHAEGMNAIRKLEACESIDAFHASDPTGEVARLIYNTVKFLNFAAHLAEERALPRQTVLNLYFFSYRHAGERLLTWWLHSQRMGTPSAFMAFERMCRHVCAITDAQIQCHDRLRPYRLLASSIFPWILCLAALAVLAALGWLLFLAIANWPILPPSPISPNQPCAV